MTERILIVHNRYQQRGGEDSVVESEISLLRSQGHAVETYFRTNKEVRDLSPISLARQTLWSSRTIGDLAQLIARFRPDVVHSHNTLPLISPSLYWAASRARIPVVQTLHNFRLICVNGVFLREGKLCEDCLGRLPWRGAARACYRGSNAASSTVALMLVLHRTLGTYRSQVTRYIALNEFCRKKFIQAGLPEHRIVVKPNFVQVQRLPEVPRHGLLFVGRLSTDKGVTILARAAALLPGISLRIAGDGQEASKLRCIKGLTLLGHLSPEDVRKEMSRAVGLVVPSMSETFGLVILEAYASGTPVIASRLEAFAGLVQNGENGLMFEPGNVRELADKLRWALAHPEQMYVMGQKARACYEASYTSNQNYEQLIGIYRSAIDDVKKQDELGS